MEILITCQAVYQEVRDGKGWTAFESFTGKPPDAVGWMEDAMLVRHAISCQPTLVTVRYGDIVLTGQLQPSF